MRVRHLLAAGFVSLAYIAGSQWLMTRTPPSHWAAFLLLAPMLGGLALWAWRIGQRWAALGAAGAIAYLLSRALSGDAASPEKLYLAQHVLIHLGLAAWFGGTLRVGRTPLVSGLALRVHRQLTPDMWCYTRQVTLAWTVYFLVMATLSALLFAFTPFAAWAWFANVATPAALVLMFAGEYLLRYRLHPEFERVGMLVAVRAYMQPEAAPAVPPADTSPPLR